MKRSRRGIVRQGTVRALAPGLAGILCAVLAFAAPAQAAEPGQILIVKTDQFADPVAGAVFEAFLSDGDGSFEPDEVDGDAKAAECTSAADGECILGPLTAGDYFVRELSAPEGYTGDDGVRGPLAVTDGAAVVIDRATDLDGDGVSDGFLNVRDVPPGRLTVSVEGGDPEFTLDPAEVDPFVLEEGESATFDDLPPGSYTLTMTDLEDDLVLDAISCGGDELDADTTHRFVTFVITAEHPIRCVFTVSEEDGDPYDTYDDDPGDPDFDFDAPFDDAGDPGSPAPSADRSGTPAGATAELPDGQLTTAGVTVDQPALRPAGDQAPATLAELPRTGLPADDLAGAGVRLVLLGTVAVLAGRRRRLPLAG